MRAFWPASALAVLLAAAPAITAGEREVTSTKVVPPDEVSKDVFVRNVAVSPEGVRGEIVNRSPQPLSDVRLLVQYDWLWKDEFHPGDDPPGFADFLTAAEVPPGGSVPFTYRPADPLPARDDGRYQVAVRVLQYERSVPSGG